MVERKIDQQSEAVRQETGEFPQNPEERFAALLASFNIGPKATTLLLLPQSGYISPWALTVAFRRVVANTDMSETSDNTAPRYCHNTLSLIGLVAKEYTIDYFGAEKLVGFGLTAAGQRYGLPAAALALDFELKNQFSLYPVFGNTNSSSPEGNRAPYTRARILEALALKKAAVRQADLLKLSTQSSLSKSLKALKEAGVIDYEAITPQTGKTQKTYVLSDLPIDHVKPVDKRPTLTRDIARICQDLAASLNPITQAQVYENLSEETKNRIQEKSFRTRTNRILTGLSKQGFLKRGQFRGADTQSAAKINEKGRLIVKEYLLPLGTVVEGRENPELEQTTRRIFADLATYSANSASLYYPYSQSIKIKENQINRTELKRHLNDKSGQSASDYAQALKLNVQTIRSYFKQLIKSGRVRVETIKGVNYYYPVSNLKNSKELVD